MSSVLTVRHQDSCCFLTLDRPATGNALNPELVQELGHALDVAEACASTVVVLEGAGKHFCTGIDLSEVEQLDDAALLGRFVAIEHLLAKVWSAPFLTVALARGRAIGAGADLFAACNQRLMLQGGSLAFPGAVFGLVLGTRRLGLRIGPDAAMEAVLSGRTIPAGEARALGLVTSVVEEQALQDELAGIRATARRCAPQTVREIKQAAFADGQGLAQDLAALTRSAQRPGLQQRILAHKNSLVQQRN